MAHKLHLNRKVYISAVAFLFFFFFTSPALSPAIFNLTIYLYWIVPFFDFKFVEYLYKSVVGKVNRYTVTFFLISFAWLFIVGQPYIFLKVCSIIFCIYYLKYAHENGLFRFLYYGVNINIVIAVIQFVSYYIDESFANSIGPTNVAKTIWGRFATATNFRIVPVFNDVIIRVCGWSREPGFFASLLIVCFLCYFFDKTKKSILQQAVQYSLFMLGYLVSFSKVSLLLVLAFIVILLRKIVDLIPIYAAIFLYALAATLAAYFMYKIGFFTFLNESWITRFGGYIMVWKLPIKQIIFGFSFITNIPPENDYFDLVRFFVRNNYNFEGLAGIVQYVGMGGFLLYCFALKHLNIKSLGVVLLFLLTLNTDPFATTSFVVLAYWLALNSDDLTIRFKRRRKKAEISEKNETAPN